MPETSLLRYSDLMTSRITWMEVLAGAHSLDEEQETRKLLGLFRIVEIGAEIAERAVTLRRERRLCLPDAVVLASAHQCACPIITCDTGDFSPDWPAVRCPITFHR
jgi:hypothetical protein